MNNPTNALTPEMIREELQLILEWGEIKNSQVLAKFLEYVVLQKLSGREDEIKEYTIGVNALGRPKDFNPQLDAAVRIHAGRLRRALNQYYHEKGKEYPITISIPKGTYVPQFISTLPEQEKTGNSLPAEEAERANGAGPVSNERSKRVLAVLPFHNLSPENSKDFFVAGIGEQLCSNLAKFQNLSVLSYYATSGYQAVVHDLNDLKKRTGLDYVLTGSVRFFNDMIRLNIELMLSETAEIVWNETYLHHYTSQNIFDIQEDITDQVLNAIADTHGIITKMNKTHASVFTRSEGIIAQEAVFQYYDYTSDYDPSKLEHTSQSLKEATTLEPGNALIYSMLADLYIHKYIGAITRCPVLLDEALRLSRIAVGLGNRCQQAYKSLAWALILSEKKELSFEPIEQCLSLNPKASSIISSIGLAYICLGEYAQGFALLLKSIYLNPAPIASCKLGLSIYHYQKKNYTESLAWLQRLAPYHSPFSALLHLAIKGNIYGTNPPEPNNDNPAPEAHAREIIGRLIFSEELKNEIIEGLRLSGLTIK